ncbi:MAG: hypothetical protein MUC41_10110 [Syntrophobacteraceae bacterium]|jgi:hypothetical protein|nr:hypothetical protein [Syntrophobacteraceae bacterium]
MQNTFAEKQPGKYLSDGESFKQVVESIAGRRSASQKRKSPRFPTVSALANRSPATLPNGELVCLSSGRMGHGGDSCHQQADDATTGGATESGAESLLHVISWINVIDFSEEGLQIELKCDNFLEYLDRPLFVQFNQARLPVNMHWFKQSGGLLRCGCSFCGAIDKDPGIASTLLGLSSNLVRYLVQGERSGNGSRPEMVFAYISTIYNLRLMFLDAVASFHESKNFILRFVHPKFHIRVDHILRKFKYSKYFQVNESRRLVNDSHFNSLIDTFLKPYQEYGCGLLGGGEDMLFLENDVFNLMMNCLVLPDPLQPRFETLGDSVNSVYQMFLEVRNRLPRTFESSDFDKQFFCYSGLIGEIVLLRERLIDFLSGVGIHWK